MRILFVVYDNDSYISVFPLGIAYLAAACRKAGHEVKIYNQDVYHFPEEHLTHFLDKEHFDVVGIGVIAGYYQYRKLLKLSTAINESKNRPFYIIGGHGPAPEPEFFLKKTKADAVVIGEANIKNNDRCMLVLSGRGCTFKCNFCYRLTEGYRARSLESIVEEIRVLQRDYLISYVDFQDELLMSSVQHIEELCEGFLRAGLKFKWFCNGRLNYARPDLLQRMKRAGCVFINYGIESLDEKALRAMNKALTVKQITGGVENTLAAGISPGLNIIFGNIGETEESLKLGVEFLLKYDDHAQLRTIRPVTPYPGCPLYYHAIEKGLLKDVEEFYENKHVNSDLVSVNFTNMSDEQVHRLLFDANET